MPDVPNGIRYRETKPIFCRLDGATAHDLMVQKIVARRRRRPYIDLVNEAPPSLKHACLAFSKPQALAKQIRMRLQEPFDNEIFSLTPWQAT